MAKFAPRTIALLALDAAQHDPKTGQFAAGQSVSTEDHRAAHAYHTAKQAEHTAKAKELGESLSRPGAGSHAAAASHHGSAAFYHNEAATRGEEGYKKKALRNSVIANSASKKIAKQGEGYFAPKQNDADLTQKYDKAAFAARALSQRWIGPRSRK